MSKKRGGILKIRGKSEIRQPVTGRRIDLSIQVFFEYCNRNDERDFIDKFVHDFIYPHVSQGYELEEFIILVRKSLEKAGVKFTFITPDNGQSDFYVNDWSIEYKSWKEESGCTVMVIQYLDFGGEYI